MELHPDKPILLVEDSPEDREVTMRAIKKAGLRNPIFWCDNGDKALDFLYQRGPYAAAGAAPRPGVVLLDLNMPGTDGRKVLGVVKQDPNLQSIPIVVLTTSSADSDIDVFFQSGASSYLVKPIDANQVVQAVQKLQSITSIRF